MRKVRHHRPLSIHLNEERKKIEAKTTEFKRYFKWQKRHEIKSEKTNLKKNMSMRLNRDKGRGGNLVFHKNPNAESSKYKQLVNSN